MVKTLTNNLDVRNVSVSDNFSDKTSSNSSTFYSFSDKLYPFVILVITFQSQFL